ncbi:MAG: hypothetical protein ACK4VI_07310 [Alphaproteobacteria bacterium]
MNHFNQTPRRKAEFINPPNTLKAKVGSGGLSEDILDKAQSLLENNTVDFIPLGEMYLASLMKGIESSRDAHPDDDKEHLIVAMLYPAMQLKANGGMFHYQLVTKIADKLIHFLEVVEKPDTECLELVMAFHTTIRAVILGRITGDGGRHGAELMDALSDACLRYFDRKNVELRDH